jgi:hypothetical protein
MCLPISSSIVKGPSCLSLCFLFGCPRKKRFVVINHTLSHLAKCGVVDDSERSCISSSCSCNTERTMVCTSSNNFNRSEASCKIVIESRMLKSRSGGSSRENPKLASKEVCAQFRAHEKRCPQIPREVRGRSNQYRRNKRSNEEAAEMCCSRAPLVRMSMGVGWKTYLDAFQGVTKVFAKSHSRNS